MTQYEEEKNLSLVSKSTKLSSSSEAEEIKEVGAVKMANTSIASEVRWIFVICRKDVVQEVVCCWSCFSARFYTVFRVAYKDMANTIAGGHGRRMVLQPKAPLGHSSAIACLFCVLWSTCGSKCLYRFEESTI